MKGPAGVLLVDKAVGPTSHDAVNTVRRLAETRKVGHAGTLDPFASGLLLLLLGSSTRLSEYFLEMEKGYEATVFLGVETDTDDPEGAVVRENPGWKNLGVEEVTAALEAFRGKVRQLPPVYSSKKVRGESAHRRVRRGESVVLEPVEVEFHQVILQRLDLPRVHLTVSCSSGTYIRAFARDLGKALGVGAHLSSLRRTVVGPFSVSQAMDLASLRDAEDLYSKLLPPALALAHLPSLDVSKEEAVRIRQGQALPAPMGTGSGELPGAVPLRLLLDGDLLAVGYREEGRIRPRKVFS